MNETVKDYIMSDINKTGKDYTTSDINGADEDYVINEFCTSCGIDIIDPFMRITSDNAKYCGMCYDELPKKCKTCNLTKMIIEFYDYGDECNNCVINQRKNYKYTISPGIIKIFGNFILDCRKNTKTIDYSKSVILNDEEFKLLKEELRNNLSSLYWAKRFIGIEEKRIKNEGDDNECKINNSSECKINNGLNDNGKSNKPNGDGKKYNDKNYDRFIKTTKSIMNERKRYYEKIKIPPLCNITTLEFKSLYPISENCAKYYQSLDPEIDFDFLLLSTASSRNFDSDFSNRKKSESKVENQSYSNAPSLTIKLLKTNSSKLTVPIAPLFFTVAQAKELWKMIKLLVPKRDVYKFIHALAPSLLLVREMKGLHLVWNYYSKIKTEEQIINQWQNRFEWWKCFN